MPENEFDIQEKETKQYISVKIGEEKFGIDIMLIISSECRRLQECQRRRSTLRVS